MNTNDQYNRNHASKRNALWKIVFVELGILGLFLIALLVYKMTGPKVNPILDAQKPVVASMQSPVNISVQKSQEQLVQEYVDGLSLEEKVGQLFYVTVGNLASPEYSGTNAYLYADASVLENIENYHPGGVIIMGENIESDSQVVQLISDMQKSSKTPLFVGVDEEGGIVSRLGSNPSISMGNVGSMQSIGATGDSRKAYEVGHVLAEGIKQYGFNMDFAPDADVLTNPANYEIGSRSFGSEPNLVADMVSNEVKGMQEYGVSAVSKHFPGHGGVIGNSHNNLQYIGTEMNDLQSCEFLPFAAAIDADTDAILISHLVLTAYESETPSTLSKQVVTGLLREELGYQGVVITDSFQMGSITENYNQGMAAVMAISAGCDMVLMPSEYAICYQSVLDGVHSGSISEAQINQACYRIIYAKVKRGILILDE